MIELELSSNGYVKSFMFKTAERILKDSIGQRERNQKHWKLPEESKYKFSKGSLIIKAKKKVDD